MDTYEDEISHKRPIDDHVQQELTFIVQYEHELNEINNANESINNISNTYYKPFRIVSEPRERIIPNDLFRTDNQHLRKSLTVIVFLCDEITDLIDISEEKVYGPLSMFGQLPLIKQQDEYVSGQREQIMGAFLPTLQEINNFIDRCYALCLNMIQQLASLYNVKDPVYRSLLQKTHLKFAFMKLAELLVMLQTIDQIVQNNPILGECWDYYKTLIHGVQTDLEGYSVTEQKMETFERLLGTLTHSIIVGDVFKGCIEQNFESLYDAESDTCEDSISIRNNQIFLVELLHCVKCDLEVAVSCLDTLNEKPLHRMNICYCFSLYALYRRLLPSNIQPDAKLHRTLWGIQKKCSFVALYHNALWYPGEFLRDFTPYDIKKPDPVEPEICRRESIKSFDAQFTHNTNALIVQLHTWLILMETRLPHSQRHEEADILNHKEFQVRIELLLKGVHLANKASTMIKTCLVAHSVMQIPLTRAALNNVAMILEALKAIELIYTKKETTIIELQVHIIRYLCSAISSSLSYIRAKITVGVKGKIESSKQDILSCLNSLEVIVKGSDWFSSTRLSVIILLSELIAGTGLCVEKESMKLYPLVMKLKDFIHIHGSIRSCCDTTLLYHHLHILPTIIESIYKTTTCTQDASRLHYTFAVFSDGIKACMHIQYTDSAPFFLAYRDYLKNALYNGIIEPLSKDVETDLRLHTHTKHLDHMQSLNPKTENMRPLKPFLDLEPIRILTLLISVKKEVTHYLDRNFYNLTTVALHDWKTYADMKSLAYEKLDLELIDSFLPMGSLDQGLDVLQIMRNIHIFVARFSYNMNMQQFIEFRPDKSSKHLSTIRIQSIASSLRQHGLGILNTTVNYTYQFLAQKFHIFNQFLFDDYIKAHCAREFRWFKKHKNEKELNNCYPYDRAMKFVKDIRKQGVFDGNKTCLDQFRILITEIGNALGYVRMVRSASMYYCSEAVKFLPDLDDYINFEEHSGIGPEGNTNPDTAGANFSSETVRSAKNLDNTINTLVTNFGEGSDYFKVLVKTFQGVLLSAENDHLKTFCMIVPALCISYVEASLVSKENMAKVVKGAPTREIYFTDDGFAMGIAYCLAILKQTKKNEALHWQDTITAKLAADSKILSDQVAERKLKEEKLKEKQKKSSSWFSSRAAKQEEEDAQDEYEDYQEVHTLQLTGKKLDSYIREYEQLFFSMNGAGIFFKRTDVDT